MKRMFAILQLLLFLFSALVPAQAKEELAKLPTLLEHYKEHQASLPNIGFYQFWKMHYGSGFSKHKAAHDHSKLPGKSPCHHLHAQTTAILTNKQVLRLFILPFFKSADLFFQNQSYRFSLIAEIWQPPRTR